MGYELDRLMRQYGLSTPTMQRYSGDVKPTAPVAPTPYTGTDKTAKANYQTELEKYNTDLGTYNTNLQNYNADQTAYNQYREDYRNRLMNTPMYLNKQFDTALTPNYVNPRRSTSTTPPSTSDGNDISTEVIVYGPDGKLYSSPREAKNAGVFDYSMESPRVPYDPNRELYKQTGSYYGNLLRAPSYSGTNTQDATSGISNYYNLTPGTGPGGQNLTFNNGLRGYYINGAAPNPLSLAFNTINSLPAGVPAGAQWDATKKQYFVPYAHGGGVRTHYDEGDLVDLSKKYDNPDEMSNVSPGFINNAMAPQDTSGVPMAMVTQRPAMPPQPQAAATEMPKSNLETIMATLAKYTGTGPDYANELRTARTAAKAESDKFAQMIQNAMGNQSSAPSKEELYWKLVSAFGSPTKTGKFSEQLSNVGSVAADYAKSVREAQKADLSTKMQLALKGQELKVAGAKEDLTTLRTLAAEDMKDKRTITTELLKEYVKSGEPQSTAGKQAKDEGLTPGTPEYQTRVKAIAASNLEAQTARIESLLAGISTAQANLLLNQTKFDYARQQNTKLTPAEVKMKSETEEIIGNADQALKDIQQAYKLNPNTFDSSLMDKGTRLLLENTSSNDPKVVATRTMENLLSKEAVGKLRASFGANPTEGERAILLQLEGINSKSREERAAIMRNTYEALKASILRNKKRLNEINAGLYRDTTQTGGLE